MAPKKLGGHYGTNTNYLERVCVTTSMNKMVNYKGDTSSTCKMTVQQTRQARTHIDADMGMRTTVNASVGMHATLTRPQHYEAGLISKN